MIRCEFPLICGLNKEVCCKECSLECKHPCTLDHKDCGNSFEECLITMECDYEEDDYIAPEFSMEAMLLLAKSDRYIKMIYEDLCKRNPTTSKESIMEVVFNGNVLYDSVMTDEYNNMLELL